MNLIKNSFIILFFSLLTLKLSDIAFGSFQDEWLVNTSLSKGTSRAIHLREFNPNQQAVVRPTNYYMQGVENLEQIDYAVNIDKNGFIKTGNPKAENPEIKILFLGGSTTETLFVPEEQRFPSIVERTLREKLDQDIEVYNSGVSGNNSMHSLFIFLGKGIPLKPTHAVLMHNFNDFALLFKTESYWVAPSGRSLIIETGSSSKSSSMTLPYRFLKAIKDFFIPNLYSYIRPRLFIDIFKPRDEFTAFRKKNFEDLNLEEYKNQFKSSLVSFIELSRAWNIEPILMTQANRIDAKDSLFQQWFSMNDRNEMTYNEFIELYKLSNQLIRELSKTYSVHLVDLDILIPKNNEFIYDTVHFNEAGSKLVADHVSKKILEIINEN
ncbi:SGNH/GDSL hydrolase family protein [Gammaproteobacteria bacterium]|nr:SGNH/GDSL hydrolase family protein [Gammaproteobacteria bacterium]